MPFKICPACKEKCGVRTKICKCSHVFISEQSIPDVIEDKYEPPIPHSFWLGDRVRMNSVGERKIASLKGVVGEVIRIENSHRKNYLEVDFGMAGSHIIFPDEISHAG